MAEASVAGMTLALETCRDNIRWDEFVSHSPQGSVFCSSAFLNALPLDWDGLFVLDNGVPLLAAVMLIKDGTPSKAPYPFTMYQGIMFAGSLAAMPYHRKCKLSLELEEFLLTELAQRYTRISLCMHYNCEDLRGFQWFNYHNPTAGQFRCDLRYTGILDLKPYATPENLLASLRTVRRQEYKKCLTGGFSIETSSDIDTFDELHRKTFDRQGIERDPLEALLLPAISKAMLDSGIGELLFCRTPSGEVASATLFLNDSRCGYYLFSTNDPLHRKTGAGSFLMVHNIMRCMEKGADCVDFLGINSPQRGDFKTSFNARPVPYFITSWEKPA